MPTGLAAIHFNPHCGVTVITSRVDTNITSNDWFIQNVHLYRSVIAVPVIFLR